MARNVSAGFEPMEAAMKLRQLGMACGAWMACGLLPAQACGVVAGDAAGVAANDAGFDKEVAAHLLVTDNEATSAGTHHAVLRNTGGTALHIEPCSVDAWPKQGNGLEASLGAFRLEPGGSAELRYTVGLNESREHDPFVMSRVFRLEVSPQGKPGPRSSVKLSLSARLDPAQLLQVSTPAPGDGGGYRCAASELEHTPQALRPLHCHNVVPDAQAQAYPLDLHAELTRAALDAPPASYAHPLWLDRLYRTRYVDGSSEALNCRYGCAIDFSRGVQDVEVAPLKPGLGYVLEPLVAGLPAISRRMLGDEPDLVLEVERRPDLMDPRTRVDTIQASCVGDDCGADAIVIDAVELVDDVGRGFAAPPADEMRRYAPDGVLSSGMTLSAAGPRERAELAWRITDGSAGSYVESHYVIDYHGRDGRARRYVSPGFGGILEPVADDRAAAVGRATVARPAVAPPWWAHEQLPGPFVRLDLPDASGAPRSVHWATPPPSSQARLFSVLIVGDDGGEGSGTLVGLPRLRADRSLDSFKVLTALHLLVPLFHNGLRPEEYLAHYDAPLEVVLSEAWFDDTIDTPDPTAALLPELAILGRSFHSLRNAQFQVSAPWLPAAADDRLPDLLLYTVHPTEHLPVTSSAFVGLPVLQFPVLPQSRALTGPTSLFGYAQGGGYPITVPGSTPIIVHPMVDAQLPALRDTLPGQSAEPLPFNSHTHWLGNPEQFRWTLLDPRTGEEAVYGSDGWVFKGLSGAAMLSEVQWEDGVLKRAVVRAVQSCGSREPDTDQQLMHTIGLDVDTSDAAGQELHAWLDSYLP